MCGIFGIVSNTKIPFNKGLFRALGIDNDLRGGDSCGIFIDGKIEYGIDDKKLFFDFYKTSELFKNTRECYCAIGHDRKASVGGVSLGAAQPVIFRNDKGEIDFVVIHNGTIYNYLDLADKYIPTLDCSKMTDSQVMATIFYNAGYDCLAEYQGGAVFFIVDYRSGKPRYFGWKGVSKKSSYTTYKAGEKGEEERPFYFAQENGVTAFSSIDTCLYVHGDNVFSLNDNSLIEFKNGKIYLIEEYDRSKMDQSGYQYENGRKKSYYPTTAYGGSAVSPRNQSAINDYYDDEYDEYYRWESYWSQQNSMKQLPSSNSNPFRSLPIDGSDRSLVNIQYDHHHDVYTNEGMLCHGEYELSVYGFGEGYSGNKSNAKHWFYNGLHLVDKNAFDFIIALMKKNNTNVMETINRYDNLIHYLTGEPYILNHINNGEWMYNENYYTHTKYTGKVLKYFYQNEITINNGKFTGEEALCFPKVYSLKKQGLKAIDFNSIEKIYL